MESQTLTTLLRARTTGPASQTSLPSSTSTQSGLSPAAIIGIAVSVAVVVAAIVIFICGFASGRRARLVAPPPSVPELDTPLPSAHERGEKPITADRVLGIDKRAYLNNLPASFNSSAASDLAVNPTIVPPDKAYLERRKLGDDDHTIRPGDAEHGPNPVIHAHLLPIYSAYDRGPSGLIDPPKSSSSGLHIFSRYPTNDEAGPWHSLSRGSPSADTNPSWNMQQLGPVQQALEKVRTLSDDGWESELGSGRTSEASSSTPATSVSLVDSEDPLTTSKTIQKGKAAVGTADDVGLYAPKTELTGVPPLPSMVECRPFIAQDTPGPIGLGPNAAGNTPTMGGSSSPVSRCESDSPGRDTSEPSQLNIEFAVPNPNTAALAMMSSATMETAYSCPECELRFRTPGQRNKHINRKHRRRYTCPVESCEKAFSLNADLERHKRALHREELGISSTVLKCPNWSCLSPEKIYTRKDNLNRHVRRCRDGNPG
ncbi:hypothetical protein BCR34DRAFT_587590 [Clohesyomyces aquaticus]|uniref:C2H2-type domain-containing protein n=1 Tax=Clohesyomyces aquaticus TaxID=1231657 RepID=A0A1Y1ZPI1_9PLEO|nr:hypothetical protein BCR34DRAFT_587590 [Clohesyomyces aquaticus]